MTMLPDHRAPFSHGECGTGKTRPQKNKQAEALRFCLPIFNYLLLRPLPRFPAI